MCRTKPRSIFTIVFYGAGWVYSEFLSERPVEPKSAIVKLKNSESLLVGEWYDIDPFDLEIVKCTDGGPGKYSLYRFDPKWNYQATFSYGGQSGEWGLSGDVLTIEGKASHDEAATFAFEDNWNVVFYRIRSDWLVMEMTRWQDSTNSRELIVSFIVRLLNAEAQRKVRDWRVRIGLLAALS
jgi:hypothetical protein